MKILIIVLSILILICSWRLVINIKYTKKTEDKLNKSIKRFSKED